MLNMLLSYKWAILGIIFIALVGTVTIQSYKISSLKDELTLCKANEVKYIATIDLQKGVIGDMQKLVKDNEEAFQLYVQSTKERIQIIKDAKMMYIEKGQENKFGIVDLQTSAKIKNFFVNEFSTLQKNLEAAK